MRIHWGSLFLPVVSWSLHVAFPCSIPAKWPHSTQPDYLAVQSSKRIFCRGPQQILKGFLWPRLKSHTISLLTCAIGHTGQSQFSVGDADTEHEYWEMRISGYYPRVQLPYCSIPLSLSHLIKWQIILQRKAWQLDRSDSYCLCFAFK